MLNSMSKQRGQVTFCIHECALVASTKTVVQLSHCRAYGSARGYDLPGPLVGHASQACQVHLWQLHLWELLHAIGQPGVVFEPGSKPGAPGHHAAAGVWLEGRFTAIESGRCLIRGQLEEGGSLQRGVAASPKGVLQLRGHDRFGEVRTGLRLYQGGTWEGALIRWRHLKMLTVAAARWD